MTSALSGALFAQIILILVGLGLLQILFYRRKISFVFWGPFAWAFGVLFLYMVGQACVQLNVLENRWHYPVLILGIVIIAAGSLVRYRAESREEFSGFQGRVKWYEAIVILLLLVKVVSCFYILMTNPVISSDAADPLRWMGLAKVITAEGILPDHVQASDRFCPSLLPAWTCMFLSRWHDNLASLPWFMTYLSIAGVSFVTCFRMTGHRFASLAGTYLFASLPIAVVHVLRPGYSDLLESYFFLTALAFILLAFFCADGGRSLVIFPLVSAVGCLLTKQEGALWALWIVMTVVSFYLNVYRQVPWGRILPTLAVLAAICYLVYFFGAEWFREHIQMGRKFESIFIKQYDREALPVFFSAIFKKGSFNLWWWFVAAMVLFLWLKKTSLTEKVLILFVVFLPGAVLYYSCFTGGILWNLIGTSVARFMLQIAGLFLPLYCFFMRSVVLRKRSPLEGMVIGGREDLTVN